MPITPTWIQQYTDSIAYSIADFNTCFIANTTSSNPSAATIIGGVSGTTNTNTYGRVLNSNDSQTELGLLDVTYATTGNISAYVTGLQSIQGFYQQFYPIFDRLDSITSGLCAYLLANNMVVGTWFARAYNNWCSVATMVTPGRNGSNAPVAITPSAYFPLTDVDSLYQFTCGAGTTMTTSGVGANASTTVAGGGVGTLCIYKSNATNAIGGASFLITYKTGDGTNATVTYTTTTGVPAASGSLATAYSIAGTNATQIVSVTGTGMTAGEQYVIGVKRPRVISSY